MKIAVLFGTRPEIIKLSPVMRLLKKSGSPHTLIHTGQHYSFDMDRVFFKDLELPEPHYKLNGRSLPGEQQGEHSGRMFAEVLPILKKERPGVLLVQGDTNSVLAGALAASKTPGVRIGHVEAGLRSYDRSMPEEVNRVLTDHLSDLLFAPTRGAADILVREGIRRSKISVTGNTIVDAVMQNLSLARRGTEPKALRDMKGGPYFLLTLHRQENVDDRRTLAAILDGLGHVSKKFKTPVLFPIHPRTAVRIKTFKLKTPDGLRLIEPTGFLDFLLFEAGARLILTDSGGLQEEACILGVPCVTLRTSTERPETLEVGCNVLAGHDPAAIVKACSQMLAKKVCWKNPFGDGHASERILKIAGSAK